MDNLDDQNTITTEVLTATGTYNIGYPIQIRWKDGDARTTIAVPTIVSNGPSSVMTLATSNFSPPTSSPASNGLSIGAKAGIGAGVVFGAAIIGMAIIVLYMRRRRKVDTAVQDPSIPEMEDQDQSHSERKWFLGGKWRSEAHSEAQQNELDSKTVHVVLAPPVELEALQSQLGTESRNMVGNRTRAI